MFVRIRASTLGVWALGIQYIQCRKSDYQLFRVVWIGRLCITEEEWKKLNKLRIETTLWISWSLLPGISLCVCACVCVLAFVCLCLFWQVDLLFETCGRRWLLESLRMLRRRQVALARLPSQPRRPRNLANESSRGPTGAPHPRLSSHTPSARTTTPPGMPTHVLVTHSLSMTGC